MAKEIETVIQESAEGPRKASSRDIEVEQHSLPDLIAADRHLNSKNAAGRGFGIRRFKARPPGPS